MSHIGGWGRGGGGVGFHESNIWGGGGDGRGRGSLSRRPHIGEGALTRATRIIGNTVNSITQ